MQQKNLRMLNIQLVTVAILQACNFSATRNRYSVNMYDVAQVTEIDPINQTPERVVTSIT